MFELADPHPDCVVQEAEYVRLLGYPRQHALEDRARELADWARDWFTQHGRPWIYARQIPDLEVGTTHFKMSGTEFQAKLLHQQFAATNATQAIAIAVSAGRECEQHARELWEAGQPDQYFFLEVFASAVVEQLVALAHGHICRWADQQGMAALPHHSPGNSGWPVTDQIRLWDVLRAGMNGRLPGELSVLESGMLRPKKSLLALVGIASNREAAGRFARLIPCETCVLPHCQFRRAPHKLPHRPPPM